MIRKSFTPIQRQQLDTIVALAEGITAAKYLIQEASTAPRILMALEIYAELLKKYYFLAGLGVSRRLL